MTHSVHRREESEKIGLRVGSLLGMPVLGNGCELQRHPNEWRRHKDIGIDSEDCLDGAPIGSPLGTSAVLRTK